MGPVRVPASQTLKAIAIDPAVNASPVAAFAYAITPASAPATAALPRLHLEALRVRSRLTLRAAHRRGIRVTLYAPEGATVVRVRLVRGRRVVAEVVRPVSRGRLLTVVLPRTRKGRHRLRRGAYRVAVAPGRSRQDYGETSRHHPATRARGPRRGLFLSSDGHLCARTVRFVKAIFTNRVRTSRVAEIAEASERAVAKRWRSLPSARRRAQRRMHRKGRPQP